MKFYIWPKLIIIIILLSLTSCIKDDNPNRLGNIILKEATDE